MDVILERVQNKFACIIGELCSEPVVLSKFAIWLDLRLAEYKAKGAISLDCSGESPDPIWLKGHEKPTPPAKRIDEVFSPRNRPRAPMPAPKTFQKSHAPEPKVYEESEPDDRLSTGQMFIKEEVTEESPDIFPVSIHRVQSANQSVRKRPLPDHTQDSYSNLSPSKMLHLDPDATGANEADNQSLMSIIQEAEEDQHATSITDNDDVSVLMATSQSGTASQSRGDNSLTFSPQNSSAPVHYSSSPSTSADDSSSLQHIASFQSSQGDASFFQDTNQSLGSPGLMLAKRRAMLETVRSRIDNIAQKSYTAIMHQVGSMATLETWLKLHGEDRNTEDIPPEELDPLLVHFFINVKRLDGGDYDTTSFQVLRSYIERFLNDRGYPHSLRKSVLFTQSHNAFTHRRKMLALKQKKVPTVRTYKGNVS